MGDALTAAGAGRARRLHRAALIAVIAVLVGVVAAIGYVQWRQQRLLDAASRYQHEALEWSFAQLETEQLRLRAQLLHYLADPQPQAADAVQTRYDIFVSRIGLVDHERAAAVMDDAASYRPAMQQLRGFVAAADRVLGRPAERAFDADAAGELLGPLEALGGSLHELSLDASHRLYRQATERNLAVREQSELGIALTVFQCLLLIALAAIVLRQVRTLLQRRRELEALATSLGAARLEAEAANRAKSAFLANISHEIRTPFHGMLGMMSLLQDGGLSPKQQAFLATARESAQHLLTILNDILDLSQLESGKLQVEPQTVELPQAIAQVEALMRPQAQAKGLTLRVDIAPSVPRWVRADPTRLKQILFNLISNALKFTPAGTVGVDVAAGAAGRIDFSITDSGIGMDEATVGRLFQRFVQADTSPSRRATGAGLGLEISRDLARLMGGDITVRSEPGTGSTFVVSLPLVAVGAPPRPAGDAAPAPVRPARALDVLVAEDHPVNRVYMEAVLDQLGHRAVFVDDGAQALEAVRVRRPDAPFDIVLMDLHMPGMDGFEAARAIRALPPPAGHVPILAVTADAFQESGELARAAGMDGIVTKPAHLPELRDALERYAAAPPTATAASPGATASAATASAASLGVAAPDSPLDLVTIARVRQAWSGARYADVLGRFFDGREHALGALRDATRSTAAPELHGHAHALRGAAANLGLKRIAEHAAALQARALCAAADELTRLIDDLEAQWHASLDECLRLGLIDGAAAGPDAGLRPPGARAPA